MTDFLRILLDPQEWDDEFVEASTATHCLSCSQPPTGCPECRLGADEYGSPHGPLVLTCAAGHQFSLEHRYFVWKGVFEAAAEEVRVAGASLHDAQLASAQDGDDLPAEDDEWFVDPETQRLAEAVVRNSWRRQD